MNVEALRQFGEAVLSIFAVVNPIGGLPTFVALTEDASPRDRRRVFRIAGVVALAIIATMAVLGDVLLTDVFQIAIDEFTFGGGLLLVVIGIRRILEGPGARQGRVLDEAHRESEQIGLAVSPIASPLLVGPGSIVTVMLIANEHGRLYALGASLVAFVGVIIILNYAHLAYRLMGRLGALAVGRVMEIFIVAIGVKFLFRALAAVFPALTAQ